MPEPHPDKEVSSVAAEPLPEDLTRELERRLEAEQTAERLPSIVEGVVREGRVLWWGASGTAGLDDDAPPTHDTQYRIGSITKTFVAVAVMRLRDEGSIDLADLIGSHLPELAGLRVTIGQLLSHTSGLRAETPGPWWERTPGGSFADLVPAALRPQDLLCRPAGASTTPTSDTPCWESSSPDSEVDSSSRSWRRSSSGRWA